MERQGPLSIDNNTIPQAGQILRTKGLFLESQGQGLTFGDDLLSAKS
jgi:hypothetical protein